MYKTNIDKDVHLNWSGGHDSLIWLSQKPLFRLAPWLHSHARRGSKSSDKVLLFPFRMDSKLYENNIKSHLNKSKHYTTFKYNVSQTSN